MYEPATLIECLGLLSCDSLYISNIFFKPESIPTDPSNKCCSLTLGGNPTDKLDINAITKFNNTTTFKEDITAEKQIRAKNIVATSTIEGINKLIYEVNYANYSGDIEDTVYPLYVNTLGGNTSLKYTYGAAGTSARFINASENTITFRYVGANGIGYPLRSVTLSPSTGVELVRFNNGWIAML